MPSYFQLLNQVTSWIQGLLLLTSRMKLYEIIKITGLTFKSLYNIRKKAIDQAFNSKVNARILASYLQDEL